MKILSVAQSPSDIGGLNVRFDNGARELTFHLHDGMDGVAATRLRETLKSYKGETIPLPSSADIKERAAARRKAVEKRKINQVNADLKALGARQIKSVEEIPNAKAFIQLARAKVFEDNDGA